MSDYPLPLKNAQHAFAENPSETNYQNLRDAYATQHRNYDEDGVEEYEREYDY